jgi:hypothetical protein
VTTASAPAPQAGQSNSGGATTAKPPGSTSDLRKKVKEANAQSEANRLSKTGTK